MKKIILLIILIISFHGVFSQVVSVKDYETGQPIDLATLESTKPKAFATTNNYGQTNISDFVGSETISIRSVGYKPLVLSYQEIENQNFTVYLQWSSFSLNEVVISATRWNQPKRDQPSKVVSISPREVVLQNPQTTADMLAISGEVFIQKSQLGGGSPMIRGFSTNRLLITVDGIRMNTAIFRSGNLQNIISIDPFTIEHSEVFFGPGSVIYGSDAIGGVMSFRTLTPQLSITDDVYISGKAVTRYSSADNERTGHFDVNIGFGKWAMVTSFSHFNVGDLKMGSNGPEEYLKLFYVERIDNLDVMVQNNDPMVQKPTGYSQSNLMQKIRFQPSENWDFQMGFHYSATSDYSRYDRLIRTKNGLPRSAEWYYGPQVWNLNELTVTNNASNGLYDQFTMRFAYQHFEESRNDRNFNDVTLYRRKEKVDAYSANIDFNKSIAGKHNLFYGLEAVYDDVRSTGTDEDIITGENKTGPSRYPRSDWSSYAIYMTYQHKISEKFIGQGGIRYNHFLLNADFSGNLAYYPFPFSTVEINQGAATGSLGVNYNPTENLTFSLAFSTGFRSPNVDDVGKVFDSEPGSVVVPNPGLKPEYAYNTEIGMAKIFGEVFKLDLTAYYTLLEDAMVRRDYLLDGRDSIMYDGEMSRVQAIQNAANAYVYGIQFGFEVKLPAGFGFSTRFNYQKGEEELDDGTKSPSRHAPPWFGITRLTFNAHKLNMQFYGIYSGKKPYSELPEEERQKPYMYAIDKDGKPWSPGWYTLNFKAMYQLNDFLLVTAGLENISDKRYRPYSSGIVAPGRNFILGLKASF